MEEEYLKSNPQFSIRQKEIASTLNLSKNPKSIDILISNIDCNPDLVVYSSKEDAKKENKFVDLDTIADMF